MKGNKMFLFETKVNKNLTTLPQTVKVMAIRLVADALCLRVYWHFKESTLHIDSLADMKRIIRGRVPRNTPFLPGVLTKYLICYKSVS